MLLTYIIHHPGAQMGGDPASGVPQMGAGVPIPQPPVTAQEFPPRPIMPQEENGNPFENVRTELPSESVENNGKYSCIKSLSNCSCYS